VNSDNNLLHQPQPINQKPNSSFKSLKQLALLAASLFIAVVAGTGGYWLGIRTGHKSEIISQPALIAITTPTIFKATPTPTVSLTTIPVMPTEIPALTANWKTYTNAKWGVSFKYPETWFPQEAPPSSQREGAVDFFPNGVTPDPGGGGETGYNFVFSVSIIQDDSPQTNEQFISEARQNDGNRVLNVAGKPAIRGDGYRGDWYYIIKLSSISQLVFGHSNNEDAVKSFDDIISTIKFTTP
jgi:hypothetical protein